MNDMRLDGAAVYVADGISLENVTVKLKEGTATANGTVKRLSSARPLADLALRFALDVPAFKVSDLPFAAPPSIPPSFQVPPMRLDGGLTVKGDDVFLEKVVVKGKAGSLTVDGSVIRALNGPAAPELEVVADLDLPALTDKDLPPLAAVPPGLELPPSRWDVDLTYTTKAIRLRKLTVKIASNEISAEGGVSDPSGRGAFDLLFKCRKFVLAELTRLTPKTRELKLLSNVKGQLETPSKDRRSMPWDRKR